MNVGIISTGRYAPKLVLDNKRLEQLVDTNDEWIITRTGISERRIIAPSREMPTPEYCKENSLNYNEEMWKWLNETENVYYMGKMAGENALNSAGIKKEDVSLLVVSCNSPLFVFPSQAAILRKMLSLDNAEPWAITSGCTSSIFHMKFIDTYLKQHGGTALSICPDALSATVDWSDRNNCVLFGDSAGAIVFSEVKEGGIQSYILGSKPSFEIALRTGLENQTINTNPLEFSYKKQIERPYFYMNGNEVFKFATRIMGGSNDYEGVIVEALKACGKTVEDIDLFIPHQANDRIIDAALKRCKINRDKVARTVDRYGNNSAASIPVALDEAVQEKRIKKGDTIVFAGFGADLSYGAAVVDWSY
ncbi:3-oxoacyl-ACP synthase [Candidatus Pacearchaeota archaeon]|nr:3-oxoacyl-ACP synthase [Candidatus Pacearchaeota archaeon]